MRRVIFLGLVIIIICFVYKQVSATELVIPDSAIRLRVVPNSNDSYDLFMKENVKRYLEDNIYTLLADTTSINEARDIINDNLDSINLGIDNIFSANNYNQEFRVNFGMNYFPSKDYDGHTYDSGDYESLVVYIGDANGDNFWCVLFPNFCLLETDKVSKGEYKFFLKDVIDKYL